MTSSRSGEDIESIEIALLLDGIHRAHGFDFREYAPASIRRRILSQMHKEKLSTVTELLNKLLHDRDCMERMLLTCSVTVTEMFRHPPFFAAFRTEVVPILRTYPFFRIWHAGCATGAEPYSMAILLHEEGIYSRCRIYATDMNAVALEEAKAGVVPLKEMQDNTVNYQRAGGKGSLSEHYTAKYDAAVLHESLRKNIIFSQHNLATDASFNEFHVILCRNVMIYFNTALQSRVHQLFYDSLVPFGVLGLGEQESIRFSLLEREYKQLNGVENLYQRAR